MAASTSPPLLPPEALCAWHPERPAQGACRRCGSFFCAQEQQQVEGQFYCATCAAHPDVSPPLEDFRLKYWGRRDLWAWSVGLSSPVLALSGLSFITTSLALPSSANLPFALMGLTALLMALVGFGFWLGLRAARELYLFTQVLVGLIHLVATGARGWVLTLVGLAVCAAIEADTCNKLFFKLEVPRSELRKAWELYGNNTMARVGMQLSLLGLLIPGVGAVGLLCALLGLSQDQAQGHLTARRTLRALASAALGALGTLGWAWALWSR